MRKPVLLWVCLAVALFGGACKGKMTGGGTLPSVAEGQKATFAFNGDSCKGDAKGKFTLVDKYAAYPGGLKLSANTTSVVSVPEIDPLADPLLSTCRCEDGWEIGFEYTSTNKSNPGSGTGYACVIDNGQGSDSESDQASITIESGPYIGYTTDGDISGNVQVYDCKEKKESEE